MGRHGGLTFHHFIYRIFFFTHPYRSHDNDRRGLSEQRLHKSLGRLEDKIEWATKTKEGEKTVGKVTFGIPLSDVGLGKFYLLFFFGGGGGGCCLLEVKKIVGSFCS